MLYKRKHAIEGNILQIALQYYQAQIELEKAMKTAMEKIDAALNSKTLNKEFQSTQRFSRWVVEGTSYHNTLCAYAGCHSNCHKTCSELDISLDKESFKSCHCMQGADTSRVCGHSYTYHYHEKGVFKQVQDFIY